jgi:hypothetical protein
LPTRRGSWRLLSYLDSVTLLRLAHDDLKRRLEHLFLQQSEIRVEIADLQARLRNTDREIDRVLSTIASGLPEVAVAVVEQDDSHSVDKLLAVVDAFPDEGYGGWAKRIYREDTPRSRHALRARLEWHRKKGRVTKSAEGKWQVMPEALRPISVKSTAVVQRDLPDMFAEESGTTDASETK